MYRLSAKIERGALRILDRWWEAVAERLEGQNVTVTIRKFAGARTLRQNRYYWGVVLRVIADEIGYADPQELHEALAQKFLGWEGPGGLRLRRRTSELTSEEFSNYVSRVKTWAEVELGIIIPEPEGDERLESRHDLNVQHAQLSP